MSRSRSFRSAVGWSFVMTGGQQVTAVVITFVLAGILGPEIFGTVAMALVYVALVQLLVQQGLVPAIVQRRDLRPAHLDTAFAMSLTTAGVLTILSVAAAPWWANVNDLPELATVIQVLAVTIPLKALVVVHEGVLRREMNFRPLAARTNAAALLGGIAGVIAAIAGAGIWALVIQQLVSAVIEVVTLWYVSPWRPGRRWERSAARDLFGFTSGSLLASIGAFANNRGDALLIGLFFGPVAVGLYRLAARVVNVVVDVAARALQQAALPELAKLQDDRERFVARATEILRLTALLSLPTFGILAGVAPVAVRLLGPEWAPAAVPLQLLCITGAVRALGLVIGAMLQASGRPQAFAVMTWSAAALSSLGFVISGLVLADASLTEQVNGVAAMRALVFGGPLFVINLLTMRRFAGVGVRQVARSVGPSGLAGGVGALVGVLLWGLGDGSGPSALASALLVFLVVAATSSVLWRLEPEARNHLAEVGRVLGRRRSVGDRGSGMTQRGPTNATSETTAVTPGGGIGTLRQGVPTAPAPHAGSRAAHPPPIPGGQPQRTVPRSYSMDLWETLRIVAQRWTVSLPLAVLTIITVLAIPGDVGQEYSSEASLVFIPPNVTIEEGADGVAELNPENPFLRQTGAVAAMTQLVQLSLTGTDVRALVEAEGLEPDYQLVVDRGTPIMAVEVTATSPSLATGTVDFLVALIERDLTERQDQVEAPDTDRIGIQVISPTSPAEASAGAATRLRLVVLVVGLALAVGAALLVEGAANWAARRRSEGGWGPSDDPEVDPSDDPSGGANAPLTGHDDLDAMELHGIDESNELADLEPEPEAEPERVDVHADGDELAPVNGHGAMVPTDAPPVSSDRD